MVAGTGLLECFGAATALFPIRESSGMPIGFPSHLRMEKSLKAFIAFTSAITGNAAILNIFGLEQIPTILKTRLVKEGNPMEPPWERPLVLVCLGENPPQIPN